METTENQGKPPVLPPEGPPKPPERRSRLSMPKKVGIAAAVLAVVFLASFLPSWVNARTARAERDAAEHSLNLARLQILLGLVGYEVGRNNFTVASQISTQFYNGVMSTALRTNDPD